MAFYVNQAELARISGRSKQNLTFERTQGRLPFDEGPKGLKLYDIDRPEIQKVIKAFPKNTNQATKEQAIAYRKEFHHQRVAQKVNCQMTGQPDFMAQVDGASNGIDALLQKTEDQDLDNLKKRKEIAKLDVDVETRKKKLTAMEGGLIERDLVEAYIDRYLGILHTRHLELHGSGIGKDIVACVLQNQHDPISAEKEVEKIISKKCSAILKDSAQAMKQNRL